jgi:hypothetical protein
MWSSSVIPFATVRLMPLNTPRNISLRWYSRDNDSGISEQNLTVGRNYLVPVVVRDERGDGRAFITNENWMLRQPDMQKWPLGPGTHDFRLQIHSGSMYWRSDYDYRIVVPQQGESNGPFTLELYYGGIF